MPRLQPPAPFCAQINGEFLHLTGQQQDLLRLLVAQCESNGRGQFILVCLHDGAWLVYPKGISLPAPYDDADFHELDRKHLIALTRNSEGQLCGKPTARGIELVRSGFTGLLPGALEGAMSDFPVLSDSAKRKLAVLWDTLRDNQKLTDEDASGYDLGRRWLLGAIAGRPHGMNLGGLNIGHTFEDRKRAASSLGLDPSVKVADGQFRGTDWEYWGHWCSSGSPYETHAAWLETIKCETVKQLESVWKGRSAASDQWFGVTCKPAIERALSTLTKERIAQAREVEMHTLDGRAHGNPLLAELQSGSNDLSPRAQEVIRRVRQMGQANFLNGKLPEDTCAENTTAIAPNSCATQPKQQSIGTNEKLLAPSSTSSSAECRSQDGSRTSSDTRPGETGSRMVNRPTAEFEGQLHLISEIDKERLRGLRRQRERQLTNARPAEASQSLDVDASPQTAAIKLAESAVREFASCLLSCQERLGVHAGLLRDYAAVVIREIREMVRWSRHQNSQPEPGWRQDPVTQKAIRTCESIIAERHTAGDPWPYWSGDLDLTWCPVVQEWEARNAVLELRRVIPHRIPESILRAILSEHLAIPESAITWDQIRKAATQLCRHYGNILLIPAELERSQAVKPHPEVIAAAQFWKEREDEFRKHASAGDCLEAQWSELHDRWSFRESSGKAAPPDQEQLFKSLAREAAKGLSPSVESDGWVVWLDALRLAADRSTRKPIYSEVLETGLVVISEKERERMIASGVSVPQGGVWEFVIPGASEMHERQATKPSDLAVKRMYWETWSENIRSPFTSSANYCLELRSLSADPTRKDAANSVMPLQKEYKTALGKNVDRLRKECGWSFDDIAEATGIDKKLILGHVNKGKGAIPDTLRSYASAFSEKLGRQVTVAEIEDVEP